MNVVLLEDAFPQQFLIKVTEKTSLFDGDGTNVLVHSVPTLAKTEGEAMAHGSEVLDLFREKAGSRTSVTVSVARLGITNEKIMYRPWRNIS